MCRYIYIYIYVYTCMICVGVYDICICLYSFIQTCICINGYKCTKQFILTYVYMCTWNVRLVYT